MIRWFDWNEKWEPSWWLNQPIWRICEPSDWIISPQNRGENTKKCLKPPPSNKHEQAPFQVKHLATPIPARKSFSPTPISAFLFQVMLPCWFSVSDPKINQISPDHPEHEIDYGWPTPKDDRIQNVQSPSLSGLWRMHSIQFHHPTVVNFEDLVGDSFPSLVAMQSLFRVVCICICITYINI